MPTLRNAHRHALLGNRSIVYSDVAQHNSVAGIRCSFQKPEFVSHRIRKDGLKDKAFALPDQFDTQSACHRCAFVGTDVQLRGNIVRINESQAAPAKVRVVEGGFPSPIGPRERDNDRSRLEDGMHLLLCPRTQRLELAIHESTRCARAVLLDPNEMITLLLVMRKWPRLKIIGDALAPA